MQASAPLADHVPFASAVCCAVAPLFPPALLPSQALHWRAVSDTSGALLPAGCWACSVVLVLIASSQQRTVPSRNPAAHLLPSLLPEAEATLSVSGSEATAVYTFDRLGQIVAASTSGRSSQAPAAASPGAAATAGAAQRGAGSVAVPAAGSRGDAGSATLLYYRQHAQRCGMMVPGEIEVVAGGSRDAGGESFAHFDVASLSAWESLEGAPPLS